MMTKKEAAKMAKLDAEVRFLRQELDRHAGIYNKLLHELVDLKVKRDRLNQIAMDLIDEAAY